MHFNLDKMSSTNHRNINEDLFERRLDDDFIQVQIDGNLNP